MSFALFALAEADSFVFDKFLIRENIMETVTERASKSGQCATGCVNVGEVERNVSMALGGLFLLCGLTKISFTTIATTLAGAAFLYRGYTGHCGMYQALHTSTADGDASPAKIG